MANKRIEISLFIIRISSAIFLGLWATLKFLRPEWTQNIWNNAYELKFLSVMLFDSSKLPVEFVYTLGVLQLVIVLCFALGLWRFWTYGLMMLMSAAGVLGSLGSYVNFNDAGELVLAYSNYPRNLMLTAIPTLGALIALFNLRDMDNLFSLSAKKSVRMTTNSDRKLYFR